MPNVLYAKPNGYIQVKYQLYGEWVNTGGNTQVQHIAFVPAINQNVFMAVTVQEGQQSYLKMVSQDNSQARVAQANATDVASKIFDPAKWNNGYSVTNGYYKVIKPSDYELYGRGIGSGRIPVQYVVYDPDAKQAVYMAIEDGYLKMVSQDNKQARNTPVSGSVVPSSVYKYGKWNNGYAIPGLGNYNVRKRY